jgi:hypothetical protein
MVIVWKKAVFFGFITTDLFPPVGEKLLITVKKSNVLT